MNNDDHESRCSRRKPTVESVRNDEKKVVNHLVYWIVGVLLTLFVIVVFMGFRYVKIAFKPVNANNNRIVSVDIPVGATNKQIGRILQKDKVIRSSTVFNYYTRVHNYTDFQAGTYNFKQSMSMDEILTELQNGTTAQSQAIAKILVREGVTIDQIGDVIQKTHSKTGFTKKQFLALMKNQKFLNKLAKKYPELLSSSMDSKDVRYHLEGYLYPLTYSVYKGESLEDVVTQMVKAENDVLKPYYSQIKQDNLTVQQFLTLASLVEREGVTDKDRRKIAGVFLNRIAAGMPLQSDISVMYALNKHKNELTYKDIKVNSPYNLYTHKGFGPGPFNSPSLNSMQAVLHPLDRDKGYLYFVANLKTGKVTYSRTYEQHLEKSASLGLD